MNEFEESLKNIPSDAEDWKGHIIDVADTAYICRQWLKSYTSAHTAADVIAMTALVLQQEHFGKVVPRNPRFSREQKRNEDD